MNNGNTVKVVFCELTNLNCKFNQEQYFGEGISIKKLPKYCARVIDQDRGFTTAFPEKHWMVFGAP